MFMLVISFIVALMGTAVEFSQGTLGSGAALLSFLLLLFLLVVTDL